MSNESPLVFQIRRFSLDDGPGIRSTVFFKGCPLSCEWCHNPEGQSREREITVDKVTCLGCGDCREACPLAMEFDRISCTACGRCTAACPSGACRVCGIHYPVDELIQHLQRDQPFFASSGGGVTLSGGEPTLHMEYVGALAEGLKSLGTHITCETCGHFPWAHFQERLLPFLDLVFFDLKLIDPAEHEKHTGVDNRLILENLLRLRDACGPELVVRTPLVPNITDRIENLFGIREWLKKKGLKKHKLLPFNPCSAVLRKGGPPAPFLDEALVQGDLHERP